MTLWIIIRTSWSKQMSSFLKIKLNLLQQNPPLHQRTLLSSYKIYMYIILVHYLCFSSGFFPLTFWICKTWNPAYWGQLHRKAAAQKPCSGNVNVVAFGRPQNCLLCVQVLLASCKPAGGHHSIYISFISFSSRMQENDLMQLHLAVW